MMGGDTTFYIKLCDDKCLVPTVRSTVYRGENLNQTLRFLIPHTVDNINVDEATVLMNYIRPDNSFDVIALERSAESYSEQYYLYEIPLTCKLTWFAGECRVWLQMMAGDPHLPTIVKTGECIVFVHRSTNLDSLVSDEYISELYRIERKLDASVKEINAVLAVKADNMVFHAEDSTIQLLANGQPVGDRIKVCAAEDKHIEDMIITTSGDLIVYFTDGTWKNLGRVVGKDGVVYVPHIDEHKILTFTIEDEPGVIPDPVDLNPFDEWEPIEDEGITDYIWESI